MTFEQLLALEAQHTGKLIVGVRRGNDTVKFVWDDESNCDMVAVGFDDATIDELIAQKAHEGVLVDGYTCSIH